LTIYKSYLKKIIIAITLTDKVAYNLNARHLNLANMNIFSLVFAYNRIF